MNSLLEKVNVIASELLLRDSTDLKATGISDWTFKPYPATMSVEPDVEQPSTELVLNAVDNGVNIAIPDLGISFQFPTADCDTRGILSKSIGSHSYLKTLHPETIGADTRVHAAVKDEIKRLFLQVSELDGEDIEFQYIQWGLETGGDSVVMLHIVNVPLVLIQHLRTAFNQVVEIETSEDAASQLDPSEYAEIVQYAEHNHVNDVYQLLPKLNEIVKRRHEASVAAASITINTTENDTISHFV